MAKTEESSAKKFVTTTTMLEWQYFQIIGELTEIQRHMSDPTCPCRLSEDLGENCLCKHTLGLSVLSAETAAMDSQNRDMFYTLSMEAKDKHERMKGFICDKNDEPDLTDWSRNWRKNLEKIYYGMCKISSKKAKLHEDLAELFEVVKPKQPWQMRLYEYIESQRDRTKHEMLQYGNVNKDVTDAMVTQRLKEQAEFFRVYEHEPAVQQALSEGKFVPASVLADYPDLQKQYQKAVMPSQARLLDFASLFDPSAQSDIDAHAKRILAISQGLSKWCPVPKKPNEFQSATSELEGIARNLGRIQIAGGASIKVVEKPVIVTKEVIVESAVRQVAKEIEAERQGKAERKEARKPVAALAELFDKPVKKVPYRGCHPDCEGCVYQVKAVSGRQHGCWCPDFRNRCPINNVWVPENSPLASLFSPLTKAQVEAAKKYQMPMFPGTAHPTTPAPIPPISRSIPITPKPLPAPSPKYQLFPFQVIEVEQGKLLEKKGKPMKTADIPKKLGSCTVVKRHDDGDLTIKCRGKAYVQTTEGRTFQEIKLNDKWDGKKEPMTQSDAVVEAGRRWKSGAIETFKSGKKRVGYVQMNFFNVMGEGTTWEEAFAEADKKAESDKRWSKEIEEGRKKSKLTEALPVCTATEAKKLERCILSVKKKGTAVSPFAVCQVSVGCKKPKTKLNEVSPEVAAAIATPKTVKLNDMFQVDLEVANPVVPGWEKMPAWVDTGGSLSIIPIKTAEKLQLQQLKNHPRENVYDARGMLKRPVFLAHIKVSGMETPDIVWGMPLEVATIGAHTLEVLGLKVDPVNKKLEKVIQNSYGGQVSFEDVSLNENEKGYCVCKDGDTLLKEKVVSGEAHSITIPVSCSTGKVAALVHLHPSGNIEASRQDLETSKRLGVPVCVVVSGQKVKCYQAVKG